MQTRDGQALILCVYNTAPGIGREDVGAGLYDRLTEVLTVGTLQTVISLELLTVLVVGPLACLVCYDIAKKNPRANILMTMIATAELYGGEFVRRHGDTT